MNPVRATDVQMIRAKAMIEAGKTMRETAAKTGLTFHQVRRIAEKKVALRNGRRQMYSEVVRMEALNAITTCGSIRRAAEVIGIGRGTLHRWLKNAAPKANGDYAPKPKPPMTWKCYCRSGFGKLVTGNVCPDCKTTRTWDEPDPED